MELAKEYKDVEMEKIPRGRQSSWESLSEVMSVPECRHHDWKRDDTVMVSVELIQKTEGGDF